MVQAALARVPELDPTAVDDISVGCGQPAGEQGHNIARVVAVLAGLDAVPATTVNRSCASSLQTTRMAFHAIRAWEGHAFVSAGVEMVSRYGNGMADVAGTENPRFAGARERTSRRAADNSDWTDPRNRGQLPDMYVAMGQTAENVATSMGLTRREQDQFAVRSQNLAEKALDSGFWRGDITPVTLPDGRIIASDDGPRRDVTLDAVAALPPALPDGTVTADNCCPLNDGAAAVIVMSDVRAAQLGVTPLARIVANGVVRTVARNHGMRPGRRLAASARHGRHDRR